VPVVFEQMGAAGLDGFAWFFSSLPLLRITSSILDVATSEGFFRRSARYLIGQAIAWVSVICGVGSFG
jgi:hypothetical protein